MFEALILIFRKNTRDARGSKIPKRKMKRNAIKNL